MPVELATARAVARPRSVSNRNTWRLALEEHAQINPSNIAAREAALLRADTRGIKVGDVGLPALVAYSGLHPIPRLPEREAPHLFSYGFRKPVRWGDSATPTPQRSARKGAPR